MRSYKESVNSLIDAVRKVAEDVPQKDLDVLIDSILNGNKIFIYGSGRSGLVGQYFSVRLVQLGRDDVHFVGDMTTPIIGKDDVVILISNTGETMSAVQTANIARRIGSEVICVTGNASSKLAHASNLVIEVKHDGQADSQYAPLGTIFEDAVSIFFDSIVPCIMKKKGIDENDMRKRHAIWV